MQVFTFLLILSFPTALIPAWALELTSEAVKREAGVDSAESITHARGRKFDIAIVGLSAIPVVYR